MSGVVGPGARNTPGLRLGVFPMSQDITRGDEGRDLIPTLSISVKTSCRRNLQIHKYFRSEQGVPHPRASESNRRIVSRESPHRMASSSVVNSPWRKSSLVPFTLKCSPILRTYCHGNGTHFADTPQAPHFPTVTSTNLRTSHMHRRCLLSALESRKRIKQQH